MQVNTRKMSVVADHWAEDLTGHRRKVALVVRDTLSQQKTSSKDLQEVLEEMKLRATNPEQREATLKMTKMLVKSVHESDEMKQRRARAKRRVQEQPRAFATNFHK